MKKSVSLLFAAALAVSLGGCGKPPGKPEGQERLPPTALKDFKALFAQNCSGCHGDGSMVGASISLNDPAYLNLITPEQLHAIIAKGVPNSRMPGFLLSNGGELTDEQIDILVKNIFLWKTGQPIAGLPPYSAPLGNATSGKAVYATYCATCHGPDGAGKTGGAGSVIDPAYLGLMTDQYLRTVVIVGRNDLGMPDCQHYLKDQPGKSMSSEEVSDVVAWLVSNRKNEFGQPLSATPQ